MDGGRLLEARHSGGTRRDLWGLLYAGAEGGTWLWFRLMPVRYALLAMVVVSISLFVAATYNMYRVPGHHSASPAPLLWILQECST
jgi:hypothetical protein